MKTSTIVFLLIAAVCARTVQGKESPGGKPIVYNHITKEDPDPADQAVAKKVYATKYHIVDLHETKSYTPSKPKKQVAAKPPRDASGKFLAGTVLVAFIVNAEGRVTDPFVIRSPNPLLNAPVLDAIKQWSGMPARLDGSPVAGLIWVRYAIEKPSEKQIQFFSQSLAIDAKGVRHSLSNNDKDSWMEDVTKRVEPDYPVDDRGEGDGHGLFRLTLDIKTGAVTNATVVVSTGSKGLDQHALSALRQWAWKPGKWRQVTVHGFFAHQAPIPFSGNRGFPSSGARPSYFPPGITR